MTGNKNSHITDYFSHGVMPLRVGTCGIYSFSCTQGKCLSCLARNTAVAEVVLGW